ncbi:MAG: ABC transporter ATP-binding protein [Planctomycetes bacterium]|nr:ABC transporter ATP-binding protein [Planctomycetota bacterium]
MISFHNLVKRYGEKTVVDQLSLDIPEGEFFSFLGPNGAGKTTTIKILAGLLLPTSGDVRVNGISVQGDYRQAKQHLSYIPDQPYLYDKLTGREFLEFVGNLYGLDPRDGERKIGELLEFFEATDYADELAESYSHGMKQKVVFTAALLHDPKVIVLDEPMVGLDPKSARLVKNLLRERARQGATVFMSTHTLSVAEELADRIGIIQKGRLIACGSQKELRGAASFSGWLEDLFLELTEEEEGPSEALKPPAVA